MLLVMFVAVLVLSRVISAFVPFNAYAEDFARKVAARGMAAFNDPDALAAELEEEHARSGTPMTVRRWNGDLVASNVDPPLPAVSDSVQLDRLKRRSVLTPVFTSSTRRFGFFLSIALPDRHDPAGYITIAIPVAVPIAERLTLFFFGALGALALGSIPLARIIARPMERLTATARALGQGDLSVRSGIRRKDEVGELAEAFDEMADRLQRLMRGEKELLANVSHELRTPLARIGVALDLAAEADAERVRAYLAEIRADLSELERLVDDVLTAARLNVGVGGNGLPPLKVEPVAVGELIERSAKQFHESHPERVLNVQVQAPLPTMEMDSTLVRRAFDNVLENARKYSDAGHPIELRARSAEGEITVEVEDHGIGIDAEDLPRLFTPFFRTDRSRARGTGGVGLGLALTKRIVEAHHGTVTVESTPGTRTLVRFVLPVPRT
jgi:two-component system, OmpR family, sensor kinase